MMNNKTIAESYANRLWNDKDINVIDELMGQNVVIHSLLGDFHGIKGMKNIAKVWLHGFGDLHVHNDIVIGENDLVSIQWRVHATHTGEFKGIEPTGKSVAYSGVTVYRIQEGKIIEYWAYIDMQHLLQQMA